MAMWMKKVWDAEKAEKLDERDEVLKGLPSSQMIQVEEKAMMQAMVEAEEDKRPDDSKVEIPSEDEYHRLSAE